jgi:hypothetical protein
MNTRHVARISKIEKFSHVETGEKLLNVTVDIFLVPVEPKPDKNSSHFLKTQQHTFPMETTKEQLEEAMHKIAVLCDSEAASALSNEESEKAEASANELIAQMEGKAFV